MSLYAVKNDKGDYLNGVAGEKLLFGGLDKDCVLNGKDVGWWAGRGYGQVIELVEKPAPVVVSAEEAEMLEQAKCDDDPAELIVWFVNSHDKYDDDRKAEDRLMRAYVNGWTVEKPKRWNVKVPHTDDSFYYKIDDEFCNAALSTAVWVADEAKFTIDEIEHYGLQDCERMEVTDHD